MTIQKGRRRRWGLLFIAAVALLAIWILNVSRAGTRVEGCVEGCATTGPRREGPLRVMTLNILHSFPRFAYLEERLAHVAEVIRTEGADIVCLQEIPWHWGSGADRLAKATGLNHVYVRANGNRWTLLFEEGEVILSRYPLREVDFIELQPNASLFEQRVALRATADTPWGPMQIYSTHLTHSDPELNRGQTESLAAFVAGSGEGPAVVGGDFNAEEQEAQIQALDWIDTYREIHPNDAGFTCCVDDLVAGQTGELDERIDYLFLVPGEHARVVSSRLVLDQPFWTEAGWHWASDHVGLLSEIELGH